MDTITRIGYNADKSGFSFTEESSTRTRCYYVMKGRVSVREASHIEHKLKKAVELGYTNVVINMCFVETLSSAGIRALLTMYKKFNDIGGSLQIENPSENVQNVLGLTALDELLLK
ncbi:MAG: STAS domain-containing protein [Oscillospiraceae bacterium]|jgi:anti-anti-sigma factor|nr:STAS domain-containing protein [Oscillospiraceae bacterium]